MADILTLGPGQPAPGGWVASDRNPNQRVWRGDTHWKTEHGPAVCIWQLGYLRRADNALLPDGTRGLAQFSPAGPDHKWRRPISKFHYFYDGWVHGSLDVSESDAIFHDAEAAPPVISPIDWQYPDLEVDLWNDPEARERCQHRGFAMALHFALQHLTCHLNSRGLWECTLRGAGALVSNLRGRGECYTDYYGREDQTLSSEYHHAAEELITRLGWERLEHDLFKAREATINQKLVEWDKRPASACPDWYRTEIEPKNCVASTRIGGLIESIHQLTAAGKISREEREELFSNLHGTK